MAPPTVDTTQWSPAQLTANVWTAENRVSSDEQFREIPLLELTQNAEFLGRFAAVGGQTKIQGIFKWEPFVKGQTVTQDPFDQGQLYYSLTDVALYLGRLGFDAAKILGSKHNGKSHPITAYANKVEDLNAWYSPSEDTLTFGRANEKWHLASDADVSVHEMGHLLLDHLHPGLGGYFGNEGGAIHEGFGDALAALRYNDPEMSEDFAVALGRPPSKTDGLRLVKNSLTLEEVSKEVHDRGRVYAGFFWGLKEKLGLPDRKAADLTLKLLINHAANYQTSRPSPGDFVEAVLRGARALTDAGGSEIHYERLKVLILEEAQKRKMRYAPSDAIPLVAAMPQAVTTFGPASLFEKVSEVPYLGGVQERYAQYYSSPTRGKIPILRRGIWVNRKPSAIVPEISVRDARRIATGEIKETIKVGEEEARQRVENKLNVGLRKIVLLRKKMAKQKLEQENRIWEGCNVVWQKNPKPAWAIYPSGSHLMYDFDLGYAHFYVDALTGKTDIHRNLYF